MFVRGEVKMLSLKTFFLTMKNIFKFSCRGKILNMKFNITVMADHVSGWGKTNF